MTSTKKPARKTHGSTSQTLAITSAPDADAPRNVSSSSSEGNKQSFILLSDYDSYLADHIVNRHLKTQLPTHSQRKMKKTPRDHLPNISDGSGNSFVCLCSFTIYLISHNACISSIRYNVFDPREPEQLLHRLR